ncbi:hypothetical protein HVA01_03000 [Halovibrio variabilis]|uniref:Uncharacterized protein n=1 Tax=Halovibrio variabilis TaxID=31910 RepID=A0A511UJ94_9GAMM|nr:hypothetical protein [Halovibrio variabilis]GEN26654.1 hypothetical protein HVA01_03000 [Halovibrio variabilis]
MLEECVGAYVFLGTDALSGYVTGQIIEVNGGQLMPCRLPTLLYR